MQGVLDMGRHVYDVGLESREEREQQNRHNEG